MVRQTTPTEAAMTLREDPAAIYLDVRSEPEFNAGHPTGAYNIPLLHLDEATGRPEPNDEFERVAAGTLGKNARIIVGCQSGGRSQRAAELLAALGFRDVTNMQGGFGGARDPSGQVSVPGWQESGLPTELTARPGRSYVELAAG